ncbi:MAG: hypothetical protein JST54_22240 [Deltaproteobacteria bacterium]|nr:hypothetical protein [Deltaproteobacteria bacterium]
METSTPVGTWYLVAQGERLELTIHPVASGFTGSIRPEGGAPEPVDAIQWDAGGCWLEFRRTGPAFVQWFRACVTEGVMAGRFSYATTSARPALTDFTEHVTGWSPEGLDTDIVPRTWNVTIEGTVQAVLRIDRDARGAVVGRLKVFADTSKPTPLCEELEEDLASIAWDGTHLAFTRANQTFRGTCHGRFIRGSFTTEEGASKPWSGARAQVLGFGLGSRLAQRDAWQQATRARIVNLTEGMRLAGASQPAVGVVDEGAVEPFRGGYPPERDDAPNLWPPRYALRKLQFSVSPGSRFDPDSPPLPRVFSGLLATPTGPVPLGGFRAVVVVNGHGGSAQQVMTSSDPRYWYGDSAARRDLVVLAIDIGHRPRWDTPPIVHRAIVDHGYADSNWEEDGERAFSVRCAIDWLLSQPNVRKDRLFMMGHALGGEVTAIVSGLDPRVQMAVVAGFSSDLHVMDLKGNHPCYRWDHADIHEYLDVSDWQALIAPRLLVVETGIADGTCSARQPPFSADKQVTRRAREAYGPSAENVIHYLHSGASQFRVGGSNPSEPRRPEGVLAANVIAPRAPGDQSWQTDRSTSLRSPSVFHLLNQFFI